MNTTTQTDPREALADRLIEGVTQALETISVHLGVELGLYRAVADPGSATERELAERAGIAVRYAREWLEQQATAGYLVCDDASVAAEQRRYRLPDGHAEVLLDPDSPFHAAPVTAMLAGTARALPDLDAMGVTSAELFTDLGGTATLATMRAVLQSDLT